MLSRLYYFFTFTPLSEHANPLALKAGKLVLMFKSVKLYSAIKELKA